MSEVVDHQRSRPARSRLARIFGKSPLSSEIRPRYRSAVGELLVGDTVDNLGPEWDALHVIPMDADPPTIDHLVIGPAGVFSIWTRNFQGQDIVISGDRLLVAGKDEPDIARARRQAEDATALLSKAAGSPITVEPILVLVNPKKLSVRSEPDSVIAVSSRNLLKMLHRSERVLNGEQVALASDVADRESTWGVPTGPAQNTEQLHTDFSRLRDEVTDATYVRFLWGGAAFLVVAAGVWIVTAMLASHAMGS